LSELHKVDYKALSLDPKRYKVSVGNFYDRQINRLKSVVKLQESVHGVSKFQNLNLLMLWFEKNKVNDETCVMHGDYKLDNLVFDKQNSKIIGILDWELSAIGHPLAVTAFLMFHCRILSISVSLTFYQIPQTLKMLIYVPISVKSTTYQTLMILLITIAI
jgi:aminoglycoside phosphotransferase (APT) family kinase protein